MNTDDIKKVLVVANNGNLQSCAKALNITAGALSKTIKRVEEQLGCQLFSRQGKTIKLNQQGKLFLSSGAPLLQEFEQFKSQFLSATNLPEIRIAGPAILTSYLGPSLIQSLPYRQPCKFLSHYEESAAQQVIKGAADVALITNEVRLSLTDEFTCIPLMNSYFKLACSQKFAANANDNKPLEQIALKALPFAIPTVSPFCGKEKQQSTDGWQKWQRTVWYRCEDYLSLLNLVKAHKAVAYLPDFVIDKERLSTIAIEQIEPEYQEQMYLMWRPSKSESWLNKFVHHVNQQFNHE